MRFCAPLASAVMSASAIPSAGAMKRGGCAATALNARLGPSIVAPMQAGRFFQEGQGYAVMARGIFLGSDLRKRIAALPHFRFSRAIYIVLIVLTCGNALPHCHRENAFFREKTR